MNLMDLSLDEFDGLWAQQAWAQTANTRHRAQQAWAQIAYTHGIPFFLGKQNQLYKAHNIQTIMMGPSVELELTMAQTVVKHTQYAMQF